MTTTQNLHLPQWEDTDRIMMDDFNDAMASIDTAVTRITFGSYTGDGTAERTIPLPHKPKLVLLMNENGTTGTTYRAGGGLAGQDHPAMYRSGNAAYPILTLTDSGFIVYYTAISASYYVNSNENNKIFHYIAMF